MDLTATIRSIPDFPKPGIVFRDMTTLMRDRDAFHESIDRLCRPFLAAGIEQVAGIEARGFIFGAAMAQRLGAGFVPVRKTGKLPARTLRETYALEYGDDSVEIHEDAFRPGERVLLVDDLIATGGTACAAATLIRRAGGALEGAAFLADLTDLGGAARLRAMGVTAHCVLAF